MLQFGCDYLEGCHPRILAKMARTNLRQTPGYGADEYCRKAKRLIRQACKAPDADVHFFVGGTQTNFTMIKAMLRVHQGVISPSTGHIAHHRGGAIEATGHKVFRIPHVDGKLTAESLRGFMQDHYNDCAVEFLMRPGLVYISLPTELGTNYSLAELRALRAVCDRFHLPLYIDGARLGYGLVADGCDVTLADVARIADVFYIGGTKVGALFGEAVVVTNPAFKPSLRTVMKQTGAILAKGRLLGIQFMRLFTDDLYFRISRHAIRMAMKLQNALREHGYELVGSANTNQIFVRVTKRQFDKLSLVMQPPVWSAEPDGGYVIRLVTSWATKEENVDALIRAL